MPVEVCCMNDLTPNNRIINGRKRLWSQKAQLLKLERCKKMITPPDKLVFPTCVNY
ncbi:hypothetical protein SAMN06296273_2414 [Nitrosomonas ureae]|uniref:Uncharacterized protein n=1 Tax=Nitrosomonas ureae TaxID=44577 RepID=A0A285C064_9PROT|nr:hypothetical protein SAMN06296273_2414 [Nitrosomonas ureae]